ncbi:hypothetical protein MC7420_1699 [Coleofasciculus chthonoplastes PCC 7420]|uniref:Uncharacterized protein n=1 Tax=Coleofasciculus chthonoplastes PCC 7420 TaxID=118168 RepID=B4VM71_9CYAN|nr:hypothetical protein MC7420_1699 [Coleofasciculus chthonoplastes PCC 7420]
MPIGKDSAHFFGINYAMPIDIKSGLTTLFIIQSAQADFVCVAAILIALCQKIMTHALTT